jgi:hypothetical protein
MEILLIIPVILWFIAIKLVSKSKFITYFVISNIAIAVAGFYILSSTKLIDMGSDAYGLTTLFALIAFGLGHVITGILFGIFLKMYQNK